MDCNEILRVVIAHDREAARLHDEAVRSRDTMAERIERRKEEIELHYRDETARAIERARAEGEASAAEERARLKTNTEKKLSAMRARFEESKEQYADAIFAMATGQADD